MCLWRMLQAQTTIAAAAGVDVGEGTQGSMVSVNFLHCPAVTLGALQHPQHLQHLQDALLRVHGGPWALLSSCYIAPNATCARALSAARLVMSQVKLLVMYEAGSY
jgi:hypothetical protein